MWSNTAVTMLLDINYPIIQAPMAGGATTAELVAAVSNAGGLGSLGAALMTPEQISETIQQIRRLTDRPFAVNLFAENRSPNTDRDHIIAMNTILNRYRQLLGIEEKTEIEFNPISFAQRFAVVLEEQPPVFSFTFGIPDQQSLQQLKARDIKIVGTATSVDEARQLEQSGVDICVTQGREAGGHCGCFLEQGPTLNTKTLVKEVTQTINLPVVAAGGIIDGNDIFSMLQQGAAAVQMGSAFLVCPEAGIPPLHKNAILALNADDTLLTRAFTGRVARSIRNRFIEEMREHEESLLDFPLQGACTKDIRSAATQQQRSEFMSLWAGCEAYRAIEKPAAQLIHDWLTQIENLQ